MAYAKIVDYAAKDALSTGNPSKLIKGTELGAEFDAIATADALNVKTTALGSGVEVFLATPSSANLAAAVTNKTGSGALVFANSPTLVTPALGTPSALVGTNITGTAAGLSIGGTAATATDTASKTGTGSTYVTNTGPTITSPTFVTPALGTPASGDLSNCTGIPSRYTLAAEVTLSGTSTDLITTIPATATKIYVMINGMSTNNSVDYIIQFGDAGGFETSGYISSASNGSVVNSTAGFIITSGSINAHVHYGLIEFRLQKSATFTWVSQGTLVLGGGGVVHQSSGIKSTSQALTSIRITTTTGTPTFDAGTVSVAYEI